MGGDDLDVARRLLPDLRLTLVAELGGGGRSSVRRVRAERRDGSSTSLIVKQFKSAGEGWVRECAALSAIPPGAPVPRLLAESATPPVAVLADLGGGACVADALLSDDPDRAAAAVVGWAEAIAALHVASRGSRPAFAAALQERAGDLPVAESPMRAELDDAVRVLDRDCGSLGVAVPTGAFADLRGLADRLGDSGPAALTPADACPDNNVGVDGRLVLLDFEGAQWRNVAWDVAYLLVPWPSCWCCWRMPDDVIAGAVAAYRSSASRALAEVGDARFERDVEAAALGWALISTTWFLDNALGQDPVTNPDRPTPTRRAMILHRLDRTAGSDEVPSLADLAGRLAAELRSRWGNVPLALAPAFDSGPR